MNFVEEIEHSTKKTEAGTRRQPTSAEISVKLKYPLMVYCAWIHTE